MLSFVSLGNTPKNSGELLINDELLSMVGYKKLNVHQSRQTQPTTFPLPADRQMLIILCIRSPSSRGRQWRPVNLAMAKVNGVLKLQK